MCAVLIPEVSNGPKNRPDHRPRHVHLCGAHLCWPRCRNEKEQYISKTIHAGLRDAQTHLIKMMGERDLGRNISSSKQTLNQNLDRWLEVCAKPRLRAKSFQDCEGLLCRYVRPRVGARVLSFHYRLRDSDALPELLDRGLSARTIRSTHAVRQSAFRQAVRWRLLLHNPAESVDLPRQSRQCVGVLQKAKSALINQMNWGSCVFPSLSAASQTH